MVARVTNDGPRAGYLIVDGRPRKFVRSQRTTPDQTSPSAGPATCVCGASRLDERENEAAELGEVVIKTLAEIYDRESSARQFLDRAGFPSHRLPSWQAAGPLEFWREVARLVRLGIIADGPRTILRLALRDFPVNPVLVQAWGHSDGDPQKKDLE